MSSFRHVFHPDSSDKTILGRKTFIVCITKICNVSSQGFQTKIRQINGAIETLRLKIHFYDDESEFPKLLIQTNIVLGYKNLVGFYKNEKGWLRMQSCQSRDA